MSIDFYKNSLSENECVAHEYENDEGYNFERDISIYVCKE